MAAATTATGYGLAFGTGSELPVQLALLIGLLAIVTAIGVVLQVLWMRWRGQRDTARRERIQEAWRKPLLQASLHERVELPPLRPSEATTVALLWTQLMDSLKGSAYQRLRTAGHYIGLREPARVWVRRSGQRQPLLGLVTLGHLGDAQDWSLVLPWLQHERPALSLAAARALIQLQPEQGLDALLKALPQRPDWPLSTIDTLLRMTGPAVADGPLRALLRAATSAQRVRWLPLMQTMTPQDAQALIDEWLAQPVPAELLAGALAQIRSPAGAPHARRALGHDIWWVRVQAAAALGRVGHRDDAPALLALLSDPQWWVRTRAAESLVTLLLPDQRSLVATWESLKDPFARDILQQAMAQRRMV